MGNCTFLGLASHQDRARVKYVPVNGTQPIVSFPSVASTHARLPGSALIMNRSRRPEIAILVLTVLAFGLISWGSLWPQEFWLRHDTTPAPNSKEAVGYIGAGVGPLTWMHQQTLAGIGIPTLTGRGTAKWLTDASSAAAFASKEVSEGISDSKTSTALPAAQAPAAQPTAAANAAAAALRPAEVADVHALPARSAGGDKGRPADPDAPAPLPAPYMGASRS